MRTGRRGGWLRSLEWAVALGKRRFTQGEMALKREKERAPSKAVEYVGYPDAETARKSAAGCPEDATRNGEQ